MDQESLQDLWNKTVSALEDGGKDPSQSIRPQSFSATHKAKLKDLPTIDLAAKESGKTPPVKFPGTQSTTPGENDDTVGLGDPSEEKTLPIAKSRRLKRQSGPLSGFEMYTEIGRGGMGTIHRGRQRSLDRDVALKQLLPHHESEEFKQIFITEARVTGWLDHPNIVPVYDFGQSPEGDPLFAMKLIRGTAWNKTLNSLKPGEEVEKQLHTLIAVCNGVAFAHSRSIVHCDLKPENVMVGDFGEVLVMDWGLALNVAPIDQEGEQNRARHKSELAEPCGTPFYMPPELAEGRGKDVGVWTDIYLLGGILHRILTGSPPHTGDSLMEVIQAASKSEIRDFPPECPDELTSLCKRALARSVRDRPKTVLEFQEELQNFLEHRESTQISDTAQALLDRCIERSNDPSYFDTDKLYADFAETVAAFKQSHLVWPENIEAKEGEHNARAYYARSALEHGDLGLAATQASRLDPKQKETKEILALIKKRRNKESKGLRSAFYAKVALIGAVLLLIAGLAWAVVFFNVQSNRERELRQDYEQAKIKEEAARARAEEAALQADRALKSEKEARLRSQKSQSEAEKARAEALKDREKAVNAKKEAERRRDESQKLLAYAYYEQAERCRAESDFLSAEALYAKSLSIQERGDIRELLQSTRFQSATQLWTSPRPFGGARVQFRPDYKQFATLDTEGRLHLWDADSQVLVETLSLTRESIISFSYSSNSKTLAVSGSGGTLVIFNLIEGKRVKQGKVHRSTATFVRFTPDGKKFITAGLSGTIKVWDSSSGRMEHSVQAHVGFINGLAVSPDGRVLVSVGYDSKLHVLYLDSKKTEENTLPAMIVDIGFDPSGQYLLLLGIDQSALFELSTRRLIPLNSGTSRAYTHAFSADGRYLALGHPDHVALWDFKTKKKIKNSIVYRSAGLSEGNTHFFAFSKDNKKLYILGENTPLLVWDLGQNKPALHLDGHRSPIVKARFSPSGHVSASLDRNGFIRLWTTSTGFCFATFATGASDFVWSHDGKHIIVARNSKFFRRRAFGRAMSQAHLDFWNIEDQKIDRSIAIPMRADRNYGIYPQTLAMALTPDGEHLVTTHSDNTARRWTLSTGKEKDVLEKNFSSINDLDISPDGRLIAAVGDNRIVYLWEAKSLRLVKRLTHNEPLTRVQFHPHKEEVSVGTRTGKVWIWDWKREEPLLTLSVQRKAVTDLSYRPDGDFLAVAGDNALIRLIDLKSGKQVLGLRCHERITRAVDFAPAGAQLLSGGDDQTVQLWALAQPYDYSSYTPFRHRVVDFAVAPDSERIVAVSERGQLKTWKLDGSGMSKSLNVRQNITRHVALSHDGKLVAVAGSPGVILVSIQDGKKEIVSTLTIRETVLGAEFGRKNNRLYVICQRSGRHEVQIWDLEKKTRIRALKQSKKYTGSARRWALSPTEKHFVTVNREGWLYLWDCLTGALIKRIQVPRRNLLSLSFNLSGTELICASRDAALSIWSVPDGHLIKKTQGIGGFIHGLAFHPGGRWLAFVNFNKELKIWDLKTNIAKISMPLTGRGFLERTPVNLQFTPDGQRLVCSGPNRSIKVWRFSTLLSVSLDSKELYEESRRRTGLRADNLRLEKTISNRLVPYAP